MPMDKTRLGNAMYDAAMAIDMHQNSDESEDIGRQRMIAMAEKIIDEITDNATVGIISTTSTPAGTGPHVHVPFTVETTGIIS